MSKKANILPPNKYYFVDEAGDPTLFDRRGNVIVGMEGCSRYFMLGMLEVPEPEMLARELTELRLRLLADPYFSNVPSFSAKQQKTALTFHAKDDLPEVRREVFSLLRGHPELCFYATVVNKVGYARHVKNLNNRSASYRYKPNELYDTLAKRLFSDKLHKSDHYDVCFARRGSSDRTGALKNALIDARRRFCERWKITPSSSIDVSAGSPADTIALQAADYFLWALQRVFEKQEDRYLQYLWPSFKQVIDTNDQRVKGYGEYYSQKKPLTLVALEKRPD